MISIFAESDKKSIAPQNFGVAIFICVFSIALSYAACFSEEYRGAFVLLNMLLAIGIVWHLRRYLRNFDTRDAAFWTKIWMYVYVFYFIVPVVFMLLVYGNVLESDMPGAEDFYSWLNIGVGAISILIGLRVGIALRKIPDDFIGLLHPMGSIYIYVMTPIETLSLFVANTDVGKKLMGPYETIYMVAVTTVTSIATVLLIIIFSRACRYTRVRGLVGDVNGPDSI